MQASAAQQARMVTTRSQQAASGAPSPTPAYEGDAVSGRRGRKRAGSRAAPPTHSASPSPNAENDDPAVGDAPRSRPVSAARLTRAGRKAQAEEAPGGREASMAEVETTDPQGELNPPNVDWFLKPRSYRRRKVPTPRPTEEGAGEAGGTPRRPGLKHGIPLPGLVSPPAHNGGQVLIPADEDDDNVIQLAAKAATEEEFADPEPMEEPKATPQDQYVAAPPPPQQPLTIPGFGRAGSASFPPSEGSMVPAGKKVSNDAGSAENSPPPAPGAVPQRQERAAASSWFWGVFGRGRKDEGEVKPGEAVSAASMTVPHREPAREEAAVERRSRKRARYDTGDGDERAQRQARMSVMGVAAAETYYVGDEAVCAAHFRDLPNVADSALGARIVFVSDECLGHASQMLAGNQCNRQAHWGGSGSHWELDNSSSAYRSKTKPSARDGWETRRRRAGDPTEPEWCLIALPFPTLIRGVEIDPVGVQTVAPQISIECSCDLDLEQDVARVAAAKEPYLCSIQSQAMSGSRSLTSAPLMRVVSSFNSARGLPIELVRAVREVILKRGRADDSIGSWHELIPLTELSKTEIRSYSIVPESNEGLKTRWLLVNLYPHGGIGRLRVYGEPAIPTITARCIERGLALDYASLTHGGWTVWASANLPTARRLLSPSPPTDGADVWWTPASAQLYKPLERQQGEEEPSHGVFIALGKRCAVHSIVVDCSKVIGEAPARVTVETTDLKPLSLIEQLHHFTRGMHPKNVPCRWISYGDVAMKDQVRVEFPAPLLTDNLPPIATHALIRIYPDGAVNRIRVMGSAVGATTPATPVEAVKPNGPPSRQGNSGRRDSAARLIASINEALAHDN